MRAADPIGQLTIHEEAERARKQIAEEAFGQRAKPRGCGIWTKHVPQVFESAAKERQVRLTERLGKRPPQGEQRELGKGARLRMLAGPDADALPYLGDQRERRRSLDRLEAKVGETRGKRWAARGPGDPCEQPERVTESGVETKEPQACFSRLSRCLRDSPHVHR